MEFDQSISVARGVPRIRDVAERLFKNNSEFGLGIIDYTPENPYFKLALASRRAKLSRTSYVPRDKMRLKELGEREYLIQAGIAYVALIDASDSDINCPLSYSTGLPLINEELAVESERSYKNIREKKGVSSGFIERIKEADQELFRALQFTACWRSTEVARVDEKETEQVRTFFELMGINGVRDMYEMLARQNSIDLFRELFKI